MAESLAPARPGVTAFETTVEGVVDGTVTLAETYFYPRGGGQPADRGVIAGTEVLDVAERNGTVVHEVADPDAVAAGQTVGCTVDESFRTYCMRAHTASHLLYGAARRRCEALGYGGFDISAERVRVDLSTPTEIDDDLLVELERLVNRAVWDSRPVTWETVPREEAFSREDVAFNTKTEDGIAGETVRVVTIEDWDVAACGGTHVENTQEIGPVTLLDRSNPGEGLTRVEFAVGPSAIRERAEERRSAMRAAATLDATVTDLAAAVERAESERESLAADLAAVRADLARARLDGAPVVDRDGVAWLVARVGGLDANDLADRSREAAGERADVVALVDEAGQYVAVASEGGVDAGDVVAEVTERFGGGGGGSPAVAQGGGLDADAEAIAAFLRGER
jgi:alanyl-tRNA synthetase